MALVEDKRERMANQLFMRGWATMQELLTVAYGEWPPRGLDINPDALYGEKVRICEATGEHPDCAGYVNPYQRRVYIDKKKLQTQGSDIHSIVGHEGLHVLQDDYGLRAELMFGMVLGRIIDGGVREPACNKIMSKLLAYDDGQLHTRFNEVSACGKELFAEEIDKYHLRMGNEIQARIHVILSEAYQDWQKMPQNRDELWKAFAASGFRLSKQADWHLCNLPPDSGARHFQHKPRYSPSAAESDAVDDFAVLLFTLSEAGNEMFWNETLPALYADLIEMYGDRKGRERFGLGVNTTAQVQQAAFGNKAPVAG